MSSNFEIEHELKMKRAAFIVLHSLALKIENKNRRDRRWWSTDFYNQRKFTLDVLDILRLDETAGHFKNFIRMASEDFEKLSNLIGPKNV